jgi:hypothetical protein
MFVFGTGKNTGHEVAMPADGARCCCRLSRTEIPAYPVIKAADERTDRAVRHRIISEVERA